MRDDGAAALEIINGWEWEGWSGFHGHETYGPITRSLSDTVNKLAFDGHPNAADAMLSLLARGALTATGSYSWRAYRNGRYQHKGTDNIPAHRWQALQSNLALPKGEDWRLPRVKFNFIDGFNGNADYSVADWDWKGNRFSVAQPGDDSLLFDNDYSEELFSAWGIELSFAPVEDDTSVEATPQSSAVASNRGRPPKWDWEGALAYVVAVANTPDGLETGPGAQAAIERLMADWFTRASNDASAPAVSEVRKRASRIMKAIGSLNAAMIKAA